MSSATTSKTGFNLHYRTIDLVTITTLAVACGVIFWGWGKIYEPLSFGSITAYPPMAGLFGGPWLIAGVLGGLIVRRPGAALATEMLAALVEMLFPGGTQWGSGVLASGFWQGLGVELVLAVFLYTRFNIAVAAIAGAAAGAIESAAYEWHTYYPDWEIGYRLAHLGLFAVSGALIAGVGGWALTRALARAGVLDAFPAGREQVSEV
ncbi:ECF transporter S component [Aeromicrobium sp.]|uniref:ECF transporter S component n=1 Tax=Aeromicrobium sp. TaxID=1871063 RepID=UPI002FCC1AC1